MTRILGLLLLTVMVATGATRLKELASLEGVRDSFGADRLTGARRAGEIERDRQASGMALGKAPPVEDQIVLRHLRECDVQGSPCRRRQNDIVECTA